MDQQGEDGPFAIGWLSNELLAGITQRLSMRAKLEAERVDGRLAAVTRALAWRRHRSLALHVDFRPDAPLDLHAGDLRFDLTDAAVIRFLVNRATVVELTVVSHLPVNPDEASLPIVDLPEKQAAMRLVATALCSAGVHLRVLSLEGTATELFGSPAPAAALFRRHAATLEQAALGFCSDRQPNGAEFPTDLYATIRSCSGLRRFAGRLQWKGSYACKSLWALLDGWPPQQCALSLSSAHARDDLFFWLLEHSNVTDLEELELHDVFTMTYNFCPRLRVLRVTHMPIFGLLFVYTLAMSFFERADTDLSLSAVIDVQWLPLSDLFTVVSGYFDGLDLQCFDAAVCAEMGVAMPAAPPPPLPPQFVHNGESVVFTLQRHGENRQLVLALFLHPAPDDDDDDEDDNGDDDEA